MSQQDFIIWVFCWVDDNLTQLQQGTRLRSRGLPPKLSDAEVITMEVIGEFLGFSTDKVIWTYFCHHWPEWFPGLGSRANSFKTGLKPQDRTGCIHCAKSNRIYFNLLLRYKGI
jgi:hypothetical protein